MKRSQWIALVSAALLMLCLFAACKPAGGDATPTPTPTGTVSDQPPQPSATAPPDNTPPATDTPPPFQLKEKIVFPDLAGFVKTADEEVVGYNDDENGVWLSVMFWPATTPGRLAEAEQAVWGPELEGYFDTHFFLGIGGELTSSQAVELPGLNRKGLGLDVTMSDADIKGLIIPSGDQIITVRGWAPTGKLQILQDGYNEFIQKLKTE